MILLKKPNKPLAVVILNGLKACIPSTWRIWTPTWLHLTPITTRSNKIFGSVFGWGTGTGSFEVKFLKHLSPMTLILWIKKALEINLVYILKWFSRLFFSTPISFFTYAFSRGRQCLHASRSVVAFDFTCLCTQSVQNMEEEWECTKLKSNLDLFQHKSSGFTVYHQKSAEKYNKICVIVSKLTRHTKIE